MIDRTINNKMFHSKMFHSTAIDKSQPTDDSIFPTNNLQIFTVGSHCAERCQVAVSKCHWSSDQQLSLFSSTFYHSSRYQGICQHLKIMALSRGNNPRLLRVLRLTVRCLHLDCSIGIELWCPLTESNCQLKITNLALYHLTKGAWYFCTCVTIVLLHRCCVNC